MNAESEVTFISDHRWMGVQAKWRYMRETQTLALAWCMRNATWVTIFKFYNISWWKRCSATHFANRAGHFTIVKFGPPIASEPVSLTSLAVPFVLMLVLLGSGWGFFWAGSTSDIDLHFGQWSMFEFLLVLRIETFLYILQRDGATTDGSRSLVETGRENLLFVLSRAEIGQFDSVLLASCPTLRTGANTGWTILDIAVKAYRNFPHYKC